MQPENAMEASHSDLTQIAVVILVAVALGLTLVRLRQPPIVGYILAGIVLGPTGLGFVPNTDSITLLAEMGVLLLLFLIGMELSLRAFMLVLRPAIVTAALQILAALAVTFAFGYFAGWKPQVSILLGFAIAVSSTALVIKMLEDIGELRTDLGRITIGVLIAQDLAIVPILLFAESLGAGQALDSGLFLKMALATGGLFVLIWFLARPGKIHIPFSGRIAGRGDMLTLTMLAMCLAGAALSGLFGISAIYGAFVAGLVVGQSNLRSEAIPATQPVQSLLIVVFFLSIGLLIDLNYVAENWGSLLLFVFGVIAIKSVLNVAILRLAGERWETAFPGGIIMSQIGEFSFVTAAVGLRTSVIDYAAYQSVIAVIAVSLLISPFWLITVRRFHDVAQKGVQNFRMALAEVYEDEIAGVEKGTAGLRRAHRRARWWVRAAKHTVVPKKSVSAEAQPQTAFSGEDGTPVPAAVAASAPDATETGQPGEPEVSAAVTEPSAGEDTETREPAAAPQDASLTNGHDRPPEAKA
jgi:CPA2 family monovalent cation:H+ antiporter-2